MLSCGCPAALNHLPVACRKPEVPLLDIAPTVENLNEYKALAESAFARMDSDSLVARIWQGDHHVWSEDPSEITDRLGWLTLPEDMGGVISALNSFGSEVVEAGYERAVLLGMGGSSLGPEVLRRTLGSAGCPRRSPRRRRPAPKPRVQCRPCIRGRRVSPSGPASRETHLSPSSNSTPSRSESRKTMMPTYTSAL